MSSKLLKFSSFLFYLLPFALISGPFLADLIVCLISIFFLIETIKNKNWQVFNNYFFKVFLLVYIYIILRNINSNFTEHNLLSSIFYIRFGIFVLAIYFIQKLNKNVFIISFFTIGFCFVFLYFDTLYQFINRSNLFNFHSIYLNRVSSFFGDEYILGSFFIRILPFFCALLILQNYNINFKKKILFIFFLISDMSIIFSGERVATGLLVIFSFLFLFISKYRFTRIYSFLTVLTLVILISLFNSSIYDRMIKFTFKSFGIEKMSKIKNSKIYFFSPEHHSMLLTSIKIVKDNVLFGHGLKSYKFLCHQEKYKTITYPSNEDNPDIGCSTHPHNIVLQILVEYGVLGICFYLLIFYFLLKKIINLIININSNHFDKNNIHISELLIYFGIFLNMFPVIPSGNIFNNWLSIIFYLPVGFIIKTKIFK